MRKLKLFVKTVAAFLGVAILCHSILCIETCSQAASADSNKFFASDTPTTRLNVLVGSAESNSLRLRFRTYVNASVVADGEKYTNVGLHLKGNYGTVQPLERKPSLTLNFDKYAKEQKFHGMDKLHLNNSVSDPSFMTELLCRDLFRAAGLPAARVSHARVSINGRDRGLYVLVEGHDKTFLRRYFTNPKGNLYDSEFLHDITDPLRRSSGTGPDDHPDLKALAQAAQEFAEHDRRVAVSRSRDLPSGGATAERQLSSTRLEELLDLDRFYSFLALEVLTCHFDGYSRGKNNYWIYHDPASGKMVFIPHGMDQMFTQPEGSLFPEFKGILARAILQTAEGRQQFRERCVTLFTNVLCPLAPDRSSAVDGLVRRPLNPTLSARWDRWSFLSNKVVDLQKKLRPELASIDTNAAVAHDRAVAALQERIARRIAHLRLHLLAPAPSLTMLAPGASVALTNWLPTVDGGVAALSETNTPGGTSLLRLVMDQPDKPALAGWEARVRLAPGRYQIVAPVASDQPVFRGPRSPMNLRVWGGEDLQFESTRPDPRHLELVRTIAIAAEEEILIQCAALSSGEPLALEIGQILLRQLD